MLLKRYLGTKLLAKKDTDRIIGDAQSSWIRSFKYKIGSQFLIDRKFPLHLYIELSRACNFKCPMCMRSESSPGGHFPEDLAKKIVTEAALKGPTSYSLHLFGEPLMNPRWDTIVEMIRGAHPGNAILLTTNGSRMDEDCCRKLLKHGVSRVFISMHSLDPEIYRGNTGGGDVSFTLRNIRTLAAMIQESGKSCGTRVFVRLFGGPWGTSFEENNLEELRKLGVAFEIREYHNFAGGRQEWSALTTGDTRWPCFHPWFTLGISVEGRVTVCCADARLGLVVGNATEQSLEDIWKSDAVESMRQEHLKRSFERWRTCGPCDTWQSHPDIFFDVQKRN